jgi:hypothetical protein
MNNLAIGLATLSPYYFRKFRTVAGPGVAQV